MENNEIQDLQIELQEIELRMLHTASYAYG